MRVSAGCPPQDLIRRMDLDGEPYLFYRSVPIDVAIIRGTVADPERHRGP